ncbi:YfcC family protein [Shimazuella kribbensis]|uniref:YfcC family protein n=1 Tax=Shimazuella kribbensis TaxID=139808 RepID=UPI00041D5D1C|nr:AbgT family transporter [Shimazuella kribbensis]
MNKSTPLSISQKTKEINVFVLLTIVLAIALILTYILPAGEYSRTEVDGRSIVVPNSYKHVDSASLNLMDFAGSFHKGMVEAGDIIFFVLIIGGAFGIIVSTGAIEAFIFSISRKLGNKEKWLIPFMMLFFAIGGSLIGMAEETLVYIPILISLSLSLGFDVLTGAAIVLVGASIGFATAVMNPFTVGVAQGIAKLPMFSGIGFRIVLFVIMYLVGVWFIYRHAVRVKKDPSKGFFGDGRYSKIDPNKTDVTFTGRHKAVLICFLLNFVWIAFGVIKYGWYMTEIAGMFILLAIVVGFIARIHPNDFVDRFMGGSAGLISGALIIGVAKAVVVILTDGRVIDTILYTAASALDSFPGYLSAIGIYVFQAVINFIVPSGSGQAALTMPIIAPLADLVGVTRQTTVLAFSLQDGIGNIILPTSGYFMAGLALAGIPWSRWVKWILPLILIQYGIGLVAVIVAHAINYGPF